MKINIIKLSFVLATTSLFMVSCNDDFVERKPAYSIDSENYFLSKTDYNDALTGVYDLLHSTYLNVMLGEIASDNTLSGGDSATDVPGIQQVDDMVHNPVNAQLKNIWDWNSAGVQRANYILEFKDKTAFEGKNQIIGETRFLRAYFRFELVKWFGGIPLNGDKRFAVGDETKIPRASVAEVYASIESDLQYAVANLNATASQTGRATKGAAQALLGKVYLYQEKYAQAASELDNVINSNKYSLVADYNQIFENENENNIESVFEIQYDDINGASFSCLQCSQGNVAVGFGGIRGYAVVDDNNKTLDVAPPFFSTGYSFNVPTEEAYNAFDSADKRQDITVLNINKWITDNKIVDPTNYPNGYNLVYKESYLEKHKGYYNRKYMSRTRRVGAPGDQNLTNPNNYRAIRYSDVLLMAAEAFNKSGNDAKATDYLNQVRRRAFGDTNHDVTTTGTSLYDAILAERRLELMGEGHRFFDLVRTKRAAQTITGFTANKNELFPIPFEEIQYAAGNWNQNPGY